MSKRGLGFELVAKQFLENIFTDLGYEVVRARNQKTGTQDGYDNLVEIVSSKYRSQTIYAECKDHSTQLNRSQAREKIPHIISTHRRIDLLLFISPSKDFSNPNEPSKLEPYYDIISNHCPMAFLTPESYVKEYFSLYPDLFKHVYKQEAEEVSEERRVALLKKFEKFIFSDKNLRKIIIEDSEKEKYIESLAKNPYYIPRRFRKDIDVEKYYWKNPDSSTDMKKLLTASKDHIVVLGNPGSGKTTELKHTAVTLWEDRKESEIIPFFTSLKNFNSTSTISNILPEGFASIPYLAVILDGLDEVYDVTDFSNKLRAFVGEQKKAGKNNIIRFIISCRTTIYTKIVKDLQGFEAVYINPISERQAIHFLSNKYKIDFLDKGIGFSFWNYRDILGNPFYLKLIGKNYLHNKVIEISRSKLISQYIQRRLKEDEKDKFRNDIDNSGKYLKLSRKLAFAMETMQLSSIDDAKAGALVEDTTQLTKNPFLEQSVDKKWSFEQKNIQEYLVADILSKMQFDQLLSIIKIDNDVNQVHPSWYNVITLLLNINFGEKDTYNQLVEWLMANDIEMIFQADAELVSEEVRCVAFKSYFQTQCLEKTLWMSNEGAAGKFGDTPSNIEYLFDNALDKTLNHRTRLSAIILLKEMSLSTVENSYSRLETLLTKNIGEFREDPEGFKQTMEYTISLIMEVYEGSENNLVDIIVGFVSEYDYPEFIHSVLSIINAENFNYYKDFVMEVLDKAMDEKQWNYRADRFRLVSTLEVITNIFKQISDSDTLLSLLDFIVQRLTRKEFREKYIQEFLRHCPSKLSGLSEGGRERLSSIIVDVVTSDKVYYMDEPLLADLAKGCSIDEDIFKRLLKMGNEMEVSVHFLQLLIKEEWYAHIGTICTPTKFTDIFLGSLRNGLMYDSLERAIKFQKYIEENTHFRFEDKVEDSLRYRKYTFHQDAAQREFDAMFDTKLLKVQIEKIFHYYNSTDLSYRDLDTFSENYYKEFELEENVSKYAKQFFWQILRRQYGAGRKMNIEDLEDVLLNNELGRLEDILSRLPEPGETSYVIRELQKEYIRNWLLSNHNIVRNFLANPKEELTNEEDRTRALFLNLLRYFKFPEFEEDFLLDLIKFVNYTEFDFEFIEELVGKDKVIERVFVELKLTDDFTRKLPLLSYLKSKSISFKLDDYSVKEDVMRSISEKKYHHARELIKLFYTGDAQVLKEIAKLYLTREEDPHLLMTIINNLVIIGEHDFVREFLTNNYDLFTGRKIIEEYSAIDYLIKVNGELAFKKLKAIVMNARSKGGDTYVYCDFGSYTNTKSIDDLIDISRYCFLLPDYYEIFYPRFGPLKIISETLISIGKSSNEEICKKILREVETLSFYPDQKQSNKFYYETLKDDLKNLIIKHKSKPYSLKVAIDFNRENDHIFY